MIGKMFDSLLARGEQESEPDFPAWLWALLRLWGGFAFGFISVLVSAFLALPVVIACAAAGASKAAYPVWHGASYLAWWAAGQIGRAHV